MSKLLFHTPVCLAYPTLRVHDLFHSLLPVDAAVSSTAAPVPPATPLSDGEAQPPPHASLMPAGIKSF